MSVGRLLARNRIYTARGDPPKCPTHGGMTYTAGGWRCNWTKDVRKEDGHGFWHVTERCEYRVTGGQRDVEGEDLPGYSKEEIG